MSRPRITGLLGTLAIAALVAACDKVTRPATRPADAEPVIPASDFDLSTPQAAVVSYVKARYDLRNLGGVKSVTTGAGALQLEHFAAEFAFSRVAVRRFGDAGRDFPNLYLAPRDDFLNTARDGTLRTDGDAATLLDKRVRLPIRLRRVEGSWRVDLAPTPDKNFTPELQDMMQREWAAIWREMTAEVEAGKYKTLDEAHNACGAKMGRITAASARLATPGQK